MARRTAYLLDPSRLAQTDRVHVVADLYGAEAPTVTWRSVVVYRVVEETMVNGGVNVVQYR